MNYLYLLLNLGSLSIPFIFSFHSKLQFYKYWKSLFLAIVITMCVFIPWDVIFTINGFWGFNETYFLGPKIFSLPIEEWLFFICIPYACVFTHYALVYYFPKTKLKLNNVNLLSYALIGLLAIIAFINYDKWYTFINALYAILVIIIVLRTNIKLLQTYYFTFLVMLIPFFMVNGILTGSFIDNEIVWYHNAENLGIRLFTIPVEDTVYALSLILTNLALTEYFQSKLISKY